MADAVRIARRARRLAGRSILIAAVVVPAFMVSVTDGTPTADVDCDLSPPGEILAVSNNVFEADKEDARRPGDMKRFVARMKEMVPFAPDVVLVQEVRATGVRTIRKQLAKRFGCKYSIAADAGRTPWIWKKKYTRLLGRDTALIANNDAVRVKRKGHITTRYKRSEAAPDGPLTPKRAAWGKLREKTDPESEEEPLKVVAVSVHFPRGSNFRNAATSERVKKRWSRTIADRLDGIMDDGTPEDNKVHVIAGDFNSHRFSGDPSNEMPPYALLTSPPYNFTDGVIENATGGNPNPIDFLFSTGKSLQAKWDKNNTHDEGSSNFYSNHDLRWSLIAPY